MSDTEPQSIPGAGPEPGTEHEQRKDEASGQRVGPPGTGERDEDAIRAGQERLEQAGGGQ